MSVLLCLAAVLSHCPRYESCHISGCCHTAQAMDVATFANCCLPAVQSSPTCYAPATRPCRPITVPFASPPPHVHSWERKYNAFMSALRRQQDQLEGTSSDPGISALVNQELGKVQGVDRLGLRCAGVGAFMSGGAGEPVPVACLLLLLVLWVSALPELRRLTAGGWPCNVHAAPRQSADRCRNIVSTGHGRA